MNGKAVLQDRKQDWCDTAHALLLAILDGALAQKRARAIRLKHIFVDMTPAAYPYRNLQDERRRSPGLACRRAGPASRSPRQQSRRSAPVELEGQPAAKQHRRRV